MESATENPDPPAENDGSEEARPAKKPRLGGGGVKKRVAEIVLVLATMARLRGGKKPTEAEVELVAEAREKLAELCEGLAPKDIAAGDAVGAAIEDLGLNSRLKDQKLGFRGPRLTIAERFLQTKKKMEESRKYPAQSSPFTSPPLQTGFNPTAESRGTPQTMRMIPSDKQSNQIGTSSHVGHVSTTMPTTVQYQLPTNDVKPSAVSNSYPSTVNFGRDSPATALPRVDRPQLKLESGPYGSSYVTQGQVSSSNPQLANAPTWSVQTQASKSGAEQNKQPMHIPAKVDATPSQMNVPRVTTLSPRDQNFVPFVTQQAPVNLPSIHQPLQPVNYSQPPLLSNTHNEIAKIVQKLLQPKLPDHPTWIPPSRDYMNKALTCQICQLTINDVDSALVCDACEKGYHTKCAQSSNQRGIPRGEWHCSRCLALSNGKPLPPKYGRVMRSNTPVKVPLATSGVQSLSDKKFGPVDPKFAQQNITANGSSALQSPAQTAGSSALQSPAQTTGVALGSNNVDTTAELKSVDAKDAQKVNSSSANQKVDEKPVLGNCTNSSHKSSEATFASSAVDSNESSSQIVKKSELCQDESVEVKPPPVIPLPETVGNKAECSQSSLDLHVVDQSEQPNHAEDASAKPQDQNPTETDSDKVKLNEASDSDKVKLNEASECVLGDDSKQDKQNTTLDNTTTSSATANEVPEHSGTSSNEPLSVEWIGNVIQVADEKNFYQTCYADGVTYNLQDPALFISVHGKLTPSKIQSMWEDGKTGSKWVNANKYIFPSDLPENLGRPCSSGSNEVYESNQDTTVMVGGIKGPCKVLPQTKFQEECGRRNQLTPESSNGLPPVYLCKWLYDEVKGSFQPISG